ncbi:protein Wnt-2 [Cloeon dipterum]|uniref:protein Wnt-2 n=1 Tax=Cloeon dipterum TaxID=197152 RepID=UPI0032207D56
MWLGARKGPDKARTLPSRGRVSDLNWHTRLLCVLCATFLLQTVGNLRVMSGVVAAMAANAICDGTPGLTPKQKQMCKATPDAFAAVSEGSKLGLTECQYQFRNHRWNCSTARGNTTFGHVMIVGSKEAAFRYAIASAGITYAVTQACSQGNISFCGCATTSKADMVAANTPISDDDLTSSAAWKWGGCSPDVKFGVRFSRKFVDAREIERDERSLMNLHNNKAGRKAVRINLQTECKCHGVSGSCTLKTCWVFLPPFRKIGDHLKKKYHKARYVRSTTRNTNKRSGPNSVSSDPTIHNMDLGRSKVPFLALHKPARDSWARQQGAVRRSPPTLQRPKRAELVYLYESPNYCERDYSKDSLGTSGRLCNRTSSGADSCSKLCCDRGYNTYQYIRTERCRCKFHWCCYVQCSECTERVEEYRCK